MKIIVGLSGGVDSSVAALLLLRQGYEVEALFMRNWDSAINNDFLGNPDLTGDVCPQEQDYIDALDVANKLGIVLHRHDFVKEYWDDVFKFFLEELKKGRTPNPDILCNKYIKFSAFMNVAKTLGADKIAMGHYARIGFDGEYKLLRGVDQNKDQSYFLSQLNQEQLSYTMFPIGDIIKSEVRKIALEADFNVARKKDSTGICFIGERRFSQFLANYLPAKEGNIVNEKLEIIGRHEGLMNYTIGQRKGLKIGGLKEYSSEPWFVSGKNLARNELHVVQGFDNLKLYSDKCIVNGVNWISNRCFEGEINVSAKFRYRQQDIPVSISWIGQDSIQVLYPGLARAVTPGQECVFYDQETCLGGGTIDKVFYLNVLRVEES